MTMTAEPLTFTQPWAPQPWGQPATSAPDDLSAQDPASPQHLRPSRKWIKWGLIIAVITTPFLRWVISNPGGYPILSIGCQLAVTLPGYIMVFYSLLYRTHIDDDTISIHIGPFRRTIDAHSITKLAITPTTSTGHSSTYWSPSTPEPSICRKAPPTIQTGRPGLNTGETSLRPPSMTTTPATTPLTLTLSLASMPSSNQPPLNRGHTN